MTNFRVAALAVGLAGLTLPAAAADLGGVKKPAPAEYVRVCNGYGDGFFYIPGTQTCLRVGGRARWEYEYLPPKNQNDGNTSGAGYRAIGRVALDARTQSEYGPVRAFVRLDVHYRSGRYASGSAERSALGQRVSATGYTQTQTHVDIESAFIQFGGLTAGRLAWFWDFGADQSFRGIGGGGSPGAYSVGQIAYTANFGAGFSATVAAQDPILLRQAIGYVTYAGSVPTFDPVTGRSRYGGNKSIPDVVGLVRVDQGWGSAQLSGVVHAVNYGFAPNGTNPDTEYGFAVQGGVKVNLPFIAAGDAIQAEASYAQGVVQTVVVGYCGYGTLNICNFSKNGAFAGNLAAVDALYSGSAATGFASKLTTSYGATAFFTHFWLPNLRQNIGGSYAKLDYARSTNVADLSLWTASTNLIWSPIKALDIGAEVIYANIRGGAGYAINGTTKATGGAGGSSDDQWQFRLRIQRDF